MCELNGRLITPCAAVAQAHDQARGFYIQNIMGGTEGVVEQWLLLKAGKFRKDGIVLSFCPFTGNCIETWKARHHAD